MTLPAWASRDLIEQIVANPPAYSITKGGWIEGGGQRRYHGTLAARLRKLRTDYLEDRYAVADALFRSGIPWEEAARELTEEAHETADELIYRLVTEPLTEVHGDPFLRSAA